MCGLPFGSIDLALRGPQHPLFESDWEIPCYDDAGAQIGLAHVSPDQPFSPSQHFNNEKYRHIRESLQAGRMPWNDTCARCAMLRPDESYRDLLQERRIITLQVEPTLACALYCPSCTRLSDLKTRNKPHSLTSQDFAALLLGLRNDGFSIEMIEYCGNGEPLNNPRFTDFVRAGRQYFPHTKQRLVTNGNFEFDEKLQRVHIDEYMVSCDGAMQSSYEKYRIKGDIGKVFRFIERIPSDVAGYRQRKIWKYILFDFNDSDEEIRLAQRLKDEMRVDELRFVRTHSASRSIRLDGDTPLPIITSNVYYDQTPMMHKRRSGFKSKTTLAPIPLPNASGFLMIEELFLTIEKRFKCKGWVACRNSCTLFFKQNGSRIHGCLKSNLSRPDVFESYPSLFNFGFEFDWLTADDCPSVDFVVCVDQERYSSESAFGFERIVTA